MWYVDGEDDKDVWDGIMNEIDNGVEDDNDGVDDWFACNYLTLIYHVCFGFIF